MSGATAAGVACLLLLAALLPLTLTLAVPAQFNSTSLNRHLGRTYNLGGGVRFGGDAFVEVLAATQTPTQKDWFGGTVRLFCQSAWARTK